MTDKNDIRIRRDGSIDMAFYADRARRMRSEQAHGLFFGKKRFTR